MCKSPSGPNESTPFAEGEGVQRWFSSSLDPCETTPEPLGLMKQSRSQHKLHHRWTKKRARVIWALGQSRDDALYKRACRMDECCRWPAISRADNGSVLTRLNECRDRMCPRCQELRGRVMSRRIADLVKGFNSARLITLTLKHREGEWLIEMLTRLAAAFRIMRTRPAWRRHVKGGVWSIEVTHGQDGCWHAHVHIIADGEYWDQRSLSAEWLSVTKDSMIVDIRPVHDREAAAAYVAAYVAKPAAMESWSDSELCEFAVAMHGRRLLHTFGTQHAAALKEEEDESTPRAISSYYGVGPLLEAAANKVPRAVAAVNVFTRLGPTLARVMGEDPSPSMPVLGEVSTESIDAAFIFLEECRGAWTSGDWSGWCERGKLPRFTPPPLPTARTDLLFDASALPQRHWTH